MTGRGSSYDVVVVGGRVAGASTAMLLARAGVRVALVDRTRHGSDTVSTHGLMRAGVLQLSRWGLLDRVVAAGTPPIRRTIFHYAGGEIVRVSIRPSTGVDALYAPRRHLLDRLLADAASEAGVEVIREARVTRILREPDGRVRGVRVRDRAGRETDLGAAITVGADGIRSTVAEQAGAETVVAGRSAGAVLYRYFADLPAAGYEWAYADRVGAGLIPTNEGLTCVFVGTAPDRMRALRRQGTEHAFGALVRAAGPRIADRVAAARPAGRMHGWAGVPGHVRRSWGPGWALVGDAGYFKDPITAHGMTDALRDAELLADAILEVAGGASEPWALARYQAVRDRLSRRLFTVTEQVAAYDWDDHAIRDLLRHVSSAMSDEVDHLAALPERRVGPGMPALVRTDSAALPG